MEVRQELAVFLLLGQCGRWDYENTRWAPTIVTNWRYNLYKGPKINGMTGIISPFSVELFHPTPGTKAFFKGIINHQERPGTKAFFPGGGVGPLDP